MMMSNAYFNSTAIDSSNKNLANSGNNASSGNLSAMASGSGGGGGGGSSNQLSSFFSNNSSNPNLANSKFQLTQILDKNKN